LAVEAQVGDFGLGDGVRLDRPLLPQVMTNPPQLAEERFVARHNRFATFERFAVPITNRASGENSSPAPSRSCASIRRNKLSASVISGPPVRIVDTGKFSAGTPDAIGARHAPPIPVLWGVSPAHAPAASGQR